MDLSIEGSEGDIARVRLAGRIVQEAPGADPMLKLLGSEGYRRHVLLNLAGASFIDSGGVGWLLKCHRCFREASGRLVLHSVPPVVSNVIRVMRLDTALKIAPDEQAALGVAKEM